MNRLDDFFERNARRLEQSRYKRWMPIYQGFRTFLFTPRRVAGKTDVQIFDAVDLKRVMIMSLCWPWFRACFSVCTTSDTSTSSR